MIEIKSWINGTVLYTAETAKDIREAVEAARKSGAYLSGAYLSEAYLRGANLRGADLSGADLSGAYLRGANLRGADLSGADLRGANLRRADLSGAGLSGADLRGAYLSGADLSGANLSEAYLRGAYLSRANLRRAYLSRADLRGAGLSGADLRGADLSGADLRGANLRGAKGLHQRRTDDLSILLDQVGKVRAYKLTNCAGEGPQYGGVTYEVGNSIEVPDADTDPQVDCGAGINVATMPWCLREYADGRRIFVVEFTRKDIACIPLGTDGKFRLFRAKVVREIPEAQIHEWLGRSE